MADPIWRDRFISLGAVESIDYRVKIQSTSEVIYQGRAFRKPGETNIRIRINDICADFYKILSAMPQADFNYYTTPVTFVVEALSGGSWTSKGSVQFFNDWSYDDSYVEAEVGMCFPINGHFDIRMPLVFTTGSSGTISVSIKYKSGSTGSDTLMPGISPYYPNNDDDFARAVRASGAGCSLFYPQYLWGNQVDKVTIKGQVVYQAVTECAKYALYYLNAYGGWDSFLIEGNDLEADNYNRFNREMEYDNRYTANRGRGNYVTEVTKGFTFHTGLLTQDQGLRMHHLIGSTDVFLYDISNGIMLPVTIPMSTCEYKTFKNQGNQLVNYTIQVEVAQNRLRR